jgi:hypothetical protein
VGIHRSISRRAGDVVGSLVSRTMCDTYGHGPYADRAWKACGVLVRFSTAGCTSIRIAVTLLFGLCI